MFPQPKKIWYTDEWLKAKDMPRAVIVKSEYDKFTDRLKRNIYTYEIKKGIEIEDNRKFYETLEAYGVRLNYNEYVYDYTPWGAEFVYNYLYIAVMLVGMAVLVYKMLDYRAVRKDFYDKINRLGASKLQLECIKNFENLIMIIVSGVLGIGAAVLSGNAIAGIVEKKLEIEFYAISKDVYIRSAIGIVAAIISGMLANIVFSFKEKRQRKNSKKHVYYSENDAKMEKRRLSLNMRILRLQERISKSEGMLQRISVRLFLLCVTLIIIGGLINMKEADKKLENSARNYDMVGYQLPINTYQYSYNFLYQYKLEEADNKHKQAMEYGWSDEMKRNKFLLEHLCFYDNDIIAELFAGIFKSEADYGDNRVYISTNTSYNKFSEYIFMGSDNLYKGFSDKTVEYLKSIEGIDSIQYSTIETQRSWLWEGMNFDDLAYEKMAPASGAMKVVTENTRYLYATEYLDPTKELYDRMSKYIEPKYRDYEAFCNGEQILVLLRKNANNTYDKSIKVGMDIRFPYYDVRLEKRTVDYGIHDDIRKVLNDVIAYYPKPGEENKYMYYNGLSQVNYFGTASKAKVVGIVYIDETNEGELSDLLSQNAYYNAIASKGLANKLTDAQNQLIKDIMDNEYVKAYKDEYKLSVKNNYFRVKFKDEAIFLATDNIIKGYCTTDEIMVENYFEKNNMYREQYFTSMLQNIVTIVLAIGVATVVMSLLTANRFRNRKKRFTNLYNIGMSKKQIKQLCMIEAIRENLWCLITLPIVLLIQYIYYSNKVHSLSK